MVEYFNNLGKIFSEKGSWYKISVCVLLHSLQVVGINLAAAGFEEHSINYPALILTILTAILYLGYHIQVYSSVLRGGKNLLPALDFQSMLMAGLRTIPVYLIWGVYLCLMILALFLISQVAGSVGIGLAAILGFVLYLIVGLSFPTVLTLWARSFSLKKVSDMFLPFGLFKYVACGNFVAAFFYSLFMVLVSVLFYISVSFIVLPLFMSSADASQTVGPLMALSVCVFFVVVYISILGCMAYIATVCNVAKEKLQDSIYWDDEYNALSDEEECADAEEDEFAGYRRNTDDELDV